MPVWYWFGRRPLAQAELTDLIKQPHTADWVGPCFSAGMSLARASAAVRMHADPASVSFEDTKLVFFETTTASKISSERLFCYLHEQNIKQCTRRGTLCAHGPSLTPSLGYFCDEPTKPNEWFRAAGASREFSQGDEERRKTIYL